MKTNRKFLVALIVAILVISMATIVKAATPNEELYNYFKDTGFTVNGKTYKATAEQLTTLERFLNTKTVTEEQVNMVKTNTEKVVNILKGAKTVDPRELSSEKFTEIQGIVDSTAAQLGITEADYHPESNTVTITYDGRTDSVPLQKEAVQTGHTYVPYIIASIAVVIAIAAIVLKRKVK